MLQAADDALDLGGGSCGLLRQIAHLVGDHGEPATLFPGSCGLDGGIEGEKVGLFGDGTDHLQHSVDLLRLRSQVLNHAVGAFDVFGKGADLAAHAADRAAALAGLLAGTLGSLRRAIGVAGDVIDGYGHLLHGFDHVGSLVQLAAGTVTQLAGCLAEVGGGAAQPRGVAYHGADQIAQLVEQLIEALGDRPADLAAVAQIDAAFCRTRAWWRRRRQKQRRFASRARGASAAARIAR